MSLVIVYDYILDVRSTSLIELDFSYKFGKKGWFD